MDRYYSEICCRMWFRFVHCGWHISLSVYFSCVVLDHWFTEDWDVNAGIQIEIQDLRPGLVRVIMADLDFGLVFTLAWTWTHLEPLWFGLEDTGLRLVCYFWRSWTCLWFGGFGIGFEDSGPWVGCCYTWSDCIIAVNGVCFKQLALDTVCICLVQQEQLNCVSCQKRRTVSDLLWNQ